MESFSGLNINFVRYTSPHKGQSSVLVKKLHITLFLKSRLGFGMNQPL